jgi:hypothetical protein
VNTFKLKMLVLVLVNLAVAVSVTAQGNKSPKPDLTGTWQLDAGKSNAPDIGKRGETIKIVHAEPELRITRTFLANGQAISREFVYFTDGKGETNAATLFLAFDPRHKRPEELQSVSVKSKTKWQGDKIVIRTSTESRLERLRMQYLVVDEWKLSADGKTLTQTSKFQSDPDTIPSFTPTPTPDEKRVYVLISK